MQKSNRFLEEAQDWKNCHSLIRVERKIYRDGKENISNSFFISSLMNPFAEQMYLCTRQHWSIENQLHWHLEVTFGEDQSAIRRDNAIVNLHVIRKWALFLLKKNPDKISLKRKRKKIARDINLPNNYYHPDFGAEALS
ncbi:ISAs1 family transposase [Eisenibacter elegans]|uniref:ISAs1 family transposase n=1 Tax=Eisenibacter elegans TaxID=997 RepID=UPI0012B6411E|nr:ISAs1 family transposase [Eisenibacter elegans]